VKKDIHGMKGAIEIARRVQWELEQEPKDLKYPGYKRRGTRASEYIANQPQAQDMISRLLKIKK
jgi:hypothetical protein